MHLAKFSDQVKHWWTLKQILDLIIYIVLQCNQLYSYMYKQISKFNTWSHIQVTIKQMKLPKQNGVVFKQGWPSMKMESFLWEDSSLGCLWLWFGSGSFVFLL